jgi:hypothetical protein
MPLDTLNPATLMSGRFRSEQVRRASSRILSIS